MRSALLIGLFIPCTAARAQSAFPPDSVVRAIAASRFAWGLAPGLVIGLLEPDGRRRFVAVGRSSGPGSRPVDSSSVFEVGSITKVFTAALLAEMVGRGELRLEDAAGSLLPDSAHVPAFAGRNITLIDLATHTSGLPRMPSNFHPANLENPFADYSAGRLFEFLSTDTLTRQPGSKYEYSNLGMGLLGFILARRAGTSYESLLVQRVLVPLGLADTRVTRTPSILSRLTTGYNNDNDPLPPWDFDALAGAGSLRSTANDLLTFLAANMASPGDALHRALGATQRMRHEVAAGGDSVGLGWHTIRRNPGRSAQPLPNDAVLVEHSGQTDGFYAFMGFDPARRMGVVVLSNSTYSIRDLGLHLLNESIPLYNRPPSWPHEVAVDTALLQRLVGEYEFSPREHMTVSRVGNRLYSQVTGQSRYGIFPRNDSTFFWKIVAAEATFDRDAAGTVTGIVMLQNGTESRARRIP